MKKLIRNTGVKCSACEGEIHVTYTYRVKSLVPPNQIVIGGENPVSRSVDSLFSCSDCGLEFQPTEKNGLKRVDSKKLISIFSNYYSLELTEELDSKRFFSGNENRKVLSVDLTYLSRYKENHFGLPRDSDGMFLRIFKTKGALLWDRYSELHARHENKSSVLRKKLQEKLNANQIDEAFKFATKHNFSLISPGVNIHSWERYKYIKKKYPKSIPQDGTRYMIGTPVSERSSVFVSTPKIPSNAVPASKVFVLEENLSLSEYWIPTDCIKTK